jgi:hypothetical protein
VTEGRRLTGCLAITADEAVLMVPAARAYSRGKISAEKLAECFTDVLNGRPVDLRRINGDLIMEQRVLRLLAEEGRWMTAIDICGHLGVPMKSLGPMLSRRRTSIVGLSIRRAVKTSPKNGPSPFEYAVPPFDCTCGGFTQMYAGKMSFVHAETCTRKAGDR